MNHKKFLVIRPDRIGDVVLSTPFPREIKKIYPDSFVTVMVTEYTKDIYLNNPYVDEIITFPQPNEKLSYKDYLKLILRLRKIKFDYAFMLLPTERINYLLFFSGIRNRIGVGHKFYQFITNTKSVYRRKYKPLRHESDYCLDMLRKIGIEPTDIAPEIHLSQSDKSKADQLKRNLISNKKLLIGINSTSGNSAPNMPVLEYRNLIKLLNESASLSVAVTDYNPPSEIDNLNGVSYPCKGAKLSDSISAFAAMDVLVSASTGPMHIAAALKVPTVSLFCPLTACSPLLWGPLGNRNQIILPDKYYCSNKCPGDPKKCNFSGEGGIDSKKVFRHLKDFLK